VQGILKGYDQLLNLVLDEAVEYIRGKVLVFKDGGAGMVAVQ
jgi:small nuclear ribonucleoprotein (snRNP)-like protein